MAHTNSTSNYELSQFIGTDKPTFLGDYNGDMQKIDAAIKGAKDTADGASTTANAASALATTASETATTAATAAASADANATTALNTANGATTTANNAATAASAASTAATNAATKADAAKTEAEAATAAVALKPSYDETFARMFSMTSEVATVTAGSGFTLGSSTSCNVAKNVDNSLGKIYGRIAVNCSAISPSQDYKIATIAANLGTRDAAFNISGLTGQTQDSGGNIDARRNAYLTVNTDGTVDIYLSMPSGATGAVVTLPPCLYVLQDFGD